MESLPQLKLEPGQVHVWFTCPEDIQDPDLLASYHSLITQEEKEKQARYIMPWHRHTSLIARVLVRCALSRYADVNPQDWRFDRNSHGKPQLAKECLLAPLHFNLSHTHGMAACAVTHGGPIGVDVERWDRQRDFDRLAARFFSPYEANLLKEVPEYAKRRLFFNIWTLKESYIKARGVGLSMGLDLFSFEVAEDGHPRIILDSLLEDDPEAWAFRLMTPTRHHVAALAAHVEPGCTFKMQSRFMIPLVSEEKME